MFSGLAAALAIVACNDSGAATEPGSISLSIATTSATVVQGGSQPVAATLFRYGGYSEAVNFSVTGQPSGLTFAVTEVRTAGPLTTATITLVVGAGVTPAVYPLVVHGTGSGVSEATRAFTLTITPDLGFSISLSTQALSIAKGASTPTTTVNVTRVSHFGVVELAVMGLPAAVTASFAPLLTGNSSVLTLTVGAAAVSGDYDLQVNAWNPARLEYVSRPLRLTVPVPPAISLSLSSVSVRAWQGNSTWLNTFLSRAGGFTGAVDITVTGAPSGVTATVYPTGNSGTFFVAIAVDAATIPGVYPLVIHGTGSGISEATATFTLTATPPGVTLTLAPATLSIVRSAAPQTTTVNVARNNFTDPVELYVDIGDFEGTLPPGVTAVFTPNPTDSNSSVLTLTVGGAAALGVHNLYVWGYTEAGWAYTPLTLTVTAP